MSLPFILANIGWLLVVVGLILYVRNSDRDKWDEGWAEGYRRGDRDGYERYGADIDGSMKDAEEIAKRIAMSKLPHARADWGPSPAVSPKMQGDE